MYIVDSQVTEKIEAMGAKSAKPKTGEDSSSSTVKKRSTHNLMTDPEATSTVATARAEKLNPSVLGREEVADKRLETDDVTSGSNKGSEQEEKEEENFP